MSSFTFYSNIPQATDNPSNPSQGQLLQNFTSLGQPDSLGGSWCTQDHYGFSTGTDGQHKQARFPNNFVPTFPTSGNIVPTLFTSNDAFSIPQLFYYTGIASQSSQQYNASSPGSTISFGGIILKWGRPSWPGQNTAVNFSPAFPHQCFSVVACNAYSGNLNATVNIVSFSPSQFVVNCPQGLSPNFSYIAIGN